MSAGFQSTSGPDYLLEWAGTFADEIGARQLMDEQRNSISGCGGAFVAIASPTYGDQTVTYRQQLGSLDAVVMVFRSGSAVVMLDYVATRPANAEVIERLASLIGRRIKAR